MYDKGLPTKSFGYVPKVVLLGTSLLVWNFFTGPMAFLFEIDTGPWELKFYYSSLVKLPQCAGLHYHLS